MRFTASLPVLVALALALAVAAAPTQPKRAWPWTKWERALPLSRYPRPFTYPSPPSPPPRAPPPPTHPAPPPRDALSAPFYVNSSLLPLIDFPLPASYAGLMPLSEQEGEENKLFFWYWPSTAQGGSENLVVWLNGGPGCSSLTGFLMENGPISFKSGSAPILNPYGWTTASDMLWIDQPLGTGYSAGGPANDITTMPQLADQFYGFLTQFYATFPTLLAKPLTLAGESYSGKYIPYIVQRILAASAAEQTATPIKLGGILMSDGTYTDFTVPQQIPASSYAATYAAALQLTNDTLATLASMSSSCGFDAVLAQVTYPPAPGLVIQIPADAGDEQCDTWDYMLYSSQNACLTPYDVDDVCPNPPDNTPAYFSRADVQALLHVPNLPAFEECSSAPVFQTSDGYDTSPPSYSLLPSLLPSLPNGITIQHGLRDALLIHTGDRIMLQNLTWGSPALQGFQAAPSGVVSTESGGGGTVVGGVWREERGVRYVELDAGHLVPYDQPAVSLHILRVVLGLEAM